VSGTNTKPIFRFLHCADLHLDSPFEGLQADDPEIAAVLRDATFKAFENVVELGRRERVDFLIVSGDVYDGADRSLRAQLRFRDMLERAAEAGIECFVAHGNHDPLDGWEADLKMSGRVHRFGGDDVEMVSIQRDGEELVHVYGISYPVREVRQNLASKFRRADDAPFAIGVLHCNVGGHPNHDNYAPCSMDDLTAAEMDYWALGHVHTRGVLNESRPCVIYPGNTQGRSVRESGARGCYLLQVDEARRIERTFVETDVVRWFEETVDIARLETVDDLLDELNEVRENVRGRAGKRAAVLRLRVIGRGKLHPHLGRLDADRDLLARLRESEPGRPDFVWVESIRLATLPEIDIKQRRSVEDFVGDFLRAAEELRNRKDEGSAIRELLTNRPEHATIATPLEQLSESELLAILQDAEAMGLDHLLRDEA